jgi:digeranylgeranylglycerophospholipid reductase
MVARSAAANMRHVDLHAPGYYFWATDTSALLDWMVDSLCTAGARVRTGCLFETAQREGKGWRVPLANGDVIQASYLVGADGPHSRVAKSLGLSSNEQFLFGVEHEYTAARMQENLLHCFIDRRLAPGYIGWALAGVRVAQIGLARRLPSPSAGSGTRHVPLGPFLEKIGAVVDVGNALPQAVRAGMIPCGGLLPRVACERAMLVGDAAGMVSPVTAGGIHTALLHGLQVGAGVAAYVRGHGQDPAAWLVRQYPQFKVKRVLRWMFDHAQSDWMFNQLLGTRALRRAAELIYFQRKGGVKP